MIPRPLVYWLYNRDIMYTSVLCLQACTYEDICITAPHVSPPTPTRKRRAQPPVDEGMTPTPPTRPPLTSPRSQSPITQSKTENSHFLLIANQILLMVGMAVEWCGLAARIRSLQMDGKNIHACIFDFPPVTIIIFPQQLYLRQMVYFLFVTEIWSLLKQRVNGWYCQ